MTVADKITAMESLIYSFARRQFAQNDITPAEARIIMECVNSKFRWNYIDASILDRIQPVAALQKETEEVIDNADDHNKD